MKKNNLSYCDEWSQEKVTTNTDETVEFPSVPVVGSERLSRQKTRLATINLQNHSKNE